MGNQHSAGSYIVYRLAAIYVLNDRKEALDSAIESQLDTLQAAVDADQTEFWKQKIKILVLSWPTSIVAMPME